MSNFSELWDIHPDNMHRKFGNDSTKIDRNMHLNPFRPTLRKRFSYRKRTIWHGSKNLEKWFELCYRRTRCKNLKQICWMVTEIWPKECLQGLSKVKVIAEGQGHWKFYLHCALIWHDQKCNWIGYVYSDMSGNASRPWPKKNKKIKKRNCCNNKIDHGKTRGL